MASGFNLTPSKNTGKLNIQGLIGEITTSKDIRPIPIYELHPYENQPFRPYTEDKLKELSEDIRMNGILSPVIVRPKDDEYQIIAGHNRVEAAKLAGFDTVPCIVKVMDDNTAQLIMVNTNLNQRQELLPSEKAFAYKMRMDSIAGATNGRTSSILSEQDGENKRQIQRYIRLTNLSQRFLDMVDSNKLPFRAGVDLSYLNQEQQLLLWDFITAEEVKVDLKKAASIRELAEQDTMNEDSLHRVFFKPAKEQKSIKISYQRISSFFPAESTPEEVEDEIVEALKYYRERN